MSKIRVLRVLEYVGERSWVENIVSRSLHGTRKFFPKGEIHAATIGEFPEILEEPDKETEQ